MRYTMSGIDYDQKFSPGEIRSILHSAVEEYHPTFSHSLGEHLDNLQGRVESIVRKQKMENKLSWVIDAYRDHRLNQDTIESLIKDLTGVICE